MALKLSKTLTTGITADYHRITNVNCQVDGKTEVELSLYLSEQARLDGNTFLQQSFFSFELPKQVFIDGNVFEECYSLIKMEVGFENAVDC